MGMPAADVDASRITVRPVPGGIELLVPKLRPTRKQETMQGSTAARTPASFQTDRRSVHAASEEFTRRSYKMTAQRAARWWKLPPSDGIEVVEEDWPPAE